MQVLEREENSERQNEPAARPQRVPGCAIGCAGLQDGLGGAATTLVLPAAGWHQAPHSNLGALRGPGWPLAVLGSSQEPRPFAPLLAGASLLPPPRRSPAALERRSRPSPAACN